MNSTYSEVLQKIILSRRSVRVFTDKPISEQDINDLVHAAIYAPSGSNAQNQRFAVIKEKKQLHALGTVRWVWPYKTRRTTEQLKTSYPAGIIGKATAAIVVFADASLTDRRCNGEYPIWESLEVSNTSASIQNILLLATSKGIASCWLSFNHKMSHSRLMSDQSICEAFPRYHIPPHLKPQGIVILGYPKRIDENGFPYGEDYHGTAHQPVARKPIDYYLIRPCSSSSDKYKQIPLMLMIKRALFLFFVRSSSRVRSFFSTKLEHLELNLIDKYYNKDK